LRNATGFVRDFGMMPRLIEDLGLGALARDVLLRKLGQIHAGVIRIMEDMAKRETGNGG